MWRRAKVAVTLLILLAGRVVAQTSATNADTTTRSLRAFDSERALDEYLVNVSAHARRVGVVEDSLRAAACGSFFRVTRRSATPRDTAATRGADVIVYARLRNTSGASVESATLEIEGTGLRALSNAEGSATLRVPPDSFEVARELTLRTRLIGYRALSGAFRAFPGDTVTIEITLCSMPLVLQQAVVNAASGASAVRSDDDQRDASDRRESERVIGRYLAILRRGRLFSVDLGSGARTNRALRLVDALEVPGDGHGSAASRYDRIFTYERRIIVWGRDDSEHMLDIASFTLGATGELHRGASYQIRMDCTFGCEPTFIAGRIIWHRSFQLGMKGSMPYASLPAFRQWTANATGQDFQPLIVPGRVYRFPSDSGFGRDVSMHTITICDARSEFLSCEAKAVIAPTNNTVYVSSTAAYLWNAGPPSRPGKTSGTLPASMLIRVPLDGTAVRAVRVAGYPPDEFSFSEEGGRLLRVFIRLSANESQMPGFDRSNSAALVRISLADFGDGAGAVLPDAYHKLPIVPGNTLENRFVDGWLIYGIGYRDYVMTPSMFTSTLFAVRTDGGRLVRLALPHMMGGIYSIGSKVVIDGSTGSGSRLLSAVNLSDGAVKRVAIKYPPHGYGELDEAFVRVDSPGAAIIGVTAQLDRHDDPIDSARATPLPPSTAVLFLRLSHRRLLQLGTIQSHAQSPATDGADACKTSCGAWFGNARALFVGARTFALLGYELVELRVAGNRVVELQRLDFMPGQAKNNKH